MVITPQYKVQLEGNLIKIPVELQTQNDLLDITNYLIRFYIDKEEEFLIKNKPFLDIYLINYSIEYYGNYHQSPHHKSFDGFYMKFNIEAFTKFNGKWVVCKSKLHIKKKYYTKEDMILEIQKQFLKNIGSISKKISKTIITLSERIPIKNEA